MNYEKKKVLVVGMARSGVAAAQLLRACGAEVTVNDSKTEEEKKKITRISSRFKIEDVIIEKKIFLSV